MINSFGLVALAEMGDKTQLLAFMLAARFRKPWAIISGIFIATILNHGLASLLGSWVGQNVDPQIMKWVLGLTFIGFALWILVPDKEDEAETERPWGAFLTTLVVFFLAEMGDKTQLATVALAARYQDVFWVSLGTTLGMLFSNGLAVFFGPLITQRIPFNYVRIITSILFFAFGVAILVYFKGF